MISFTGGMLAMVTRESSMKHINTDTPSTLMLHTQIIHSIETCRVEEDRGDAGNTSKCLAAPLAVLPTW